MVATSDTKTCANCNEQKPLTAFHKDARNLDGRHSHCKLCRGTKTPRDAAKPTDVRADFDVWHQEFSRFVVCVQCQDAASLPDTITSISKAKSYLKRTPPTCNQHRDPVLNVRARLRSRRWFESLETTIKHIDFCHLITVVLRNFKHQRSIEGVTAWLKGQRDELPQPIIDLIETWVDRTSDRAKVTELNERLPIITMKRQRSIDKNEMSSDHYDEQQRLIHGDNNFNSIIDLALLSL